MMAIDIKQRVQSLFNLTNLDAQSELVTKYGLFKLGRVPTRDYFLQELAYLVYKTVGNQVEQSNKNWMIISGGGTNLAEYFARALSQILKDKQTLQIVDVKKNIDPLEDYSSSSLERRKQLAKGLFKCSTRFEGKHIIVIDDMVVTGTVLQEAQRMILQNGGNPDAIHAFSFIKAMVSTPQDEGRIVSDCFSRLTIYDIADMMNDPEYHVTSGMIKMLVSQQHIDLSELASLLWPPRRRFIKNSILDYYGDIPVAQRLHSFLRSCVSSNSLECDIRELLLHVPSISPGLVKRASYGVPLHEFLRMLEQHNAIRMIPDQRIEFAGFCYPDAGKQDWKPLYIDSFKKRTWYQQKISQPWFQERLLLLEERGNALRDLVHHEIVKKIGNSQYAFAVYGAFLFREKPRANDLDAIVINDSSELQIFGSQEIEIPGLSKLFPFLARDKLDLNVVSLTALRNSRSETSMRMFCTLGHALFLVGEELHPVPAYMYFLTIKEMWSRQVWTFLDDPQTNVPPKMIARVENIRAIFNTILRHTNVVLNPVDHDLLNDDTQFNPREYETIREFYPRMTVLIGHFIDLIEGSMKRMVRDSLLRIQPHTQTLNELPPIRLSHVTPDFNQICGISKYSMALHQSLCNLPNVSVRHIGISEENTTKDPNSFTEALKQAVRDDPDIVHIHFADGLLRRNNSEDFIEFTEEHAKILAQAKIVVTTLYELGPRMLSANRLPQNIFLDTTHPQRVAMMDHVREQVKRLLGVAKGIIVHSEEQLGLLHNDPDFSETVYRNRAQVQVMRHGIPSPSKEFDDPEHRAFMRSSMREKLKIGENQFVLIQFGFIRSNKYGIDMLGLLERETDFVWLLAGGLRQASHKSYQDQLLTQSQERGVRDRVIVTGRLADADISPVFAAADVAVIPYKTGTDSYALATCLGHGFPVIGSGLPFIKDYQRRYGDVIYAASNDTMFERQARYLADHRDYLNILKQATSFPRTLDSWYQVALQTQAFYSHLMA